MLKASAFGRCGCRHGPSTFAKSSRRARRCQPVRVVLEELKGEQRDSTSFDAVYTSNKLPKVTVGPITLRSIEGRGRGVVAEREVLPGELLIVSAPLALVRKEMGDVPEPQELLAHLKAKQLTSTQLQQLSALYAGGTVPPGLLPGFGEDPTTSGTPAGQCSLPDEQLANMISFNVFGEQAEDLPAALCRGDTLSGHLGIWPEFCMLNHSCLPNANSLVVGDRMLVRAARNIKPNEEVTINYLGRSSLAPRSLRVQELQDSYGFSCSCPRCQAEEQKQPEVSGAMARVYAWLQQEILPQLNEAFSTQNKEKIVALRNELNEMLESIESELSEMDLKPDMQAWLLAGAFDLYSTYNNVLGEEGKYDEQVGQCATALAGRVAPGSDLHVLMAVQLLNKVLENHGLDSQQALIVGNEVQLAVALRYGTDLKPETLQLLVKNATEALELIAL